MKSAIATLGVCCLVYFTGCGSNGGGNTSIIPPVQAATGYSNASITGTYAYSLKYGGTDENLYGTFVADGGGNITSGLMNVNINPIVGSPNNTCAYTFTGTYSVATSGIGTSTWTPTPSTTSPCSVAYFGQATFSIVAAQQGNAIHFAGNEGNITNFHANDAAFAASKQ